ncbi:uncharacterized protein EI97DRAFT_267175 [Westerdykella ornata]|uniref:Uncharacterized protein n=1 Tax=Westerdykella ornata TaxID=318751 RepID=A0A6A6J5K8_WESOR|nr:uncharacterized protein EI97DRAFT_267175 [Westerdykella ornata]KAF2271477.1 hypothetical protein EI97DRAFT_267175 [Westerdykella ornata]
MEEDLVLIEKLPAMSLVPGQPWRESLLEPPPPPPPPPPPSSEPSLVPIKSRKPARHVKSLHKLAGLDDDADDPACPENLFQTTPNAFDWHHTTASLLAGDPAKSRASPSGFTTGSDPCPPQPPPPLGVLPPPPLQILPPPPPPPVTFLAPPPPPPISPRRVYSPDVFIPSTISYFPNSTSDFLHLEPFKRTVLSLVHDAAPADLDNYRWILQHGSPDAWYARPCKAAETALLSGSSIMESCDIGSAPVQCCQIPRVWASAALTTPDRDEESCDSCDSCGCSNSLRRPCLSPLVYNIVVSTFAVPAEGSSYNSYGRQVYRLFKCGSRDAAVAEVFYTAGMLGWNVVFSCVMRKGETFDEQSGPIDRVHKLRSLIEEGRDGEKVRVFY